MIICTSPTTESQRELINAINLFGTSSNLAFNESLLLCADGEIHFESLKNAANRLAKRHDSLRMTFSPDGTTLSIHDQLPPIVDFVDLNKTGNPKAQLDAVRKDAVAQEFNIETGPLLKLILIRESAAKNYIVMVVHHLVCDGWSFAVLLEDLALLYGKQQSNSSAVLAKENYYIDYMHALGREEYREKERLDLDFWTKTYHKLPDALELPGDYSPVIERQLDASYQEHVLDADFVQRLRAAARQNKCSLVVLLLTAFGSLLNRLSGNESVVVALPSAGQAITGLDRVVGHCVNTLPILITIVDDIPLQQLLIQFRDDFLEQSEHQHITQGGLLQRLPLKRDLNSAPLASVMFNLDQDMHSFSFADTPVTVGANPRLYEYFDIFLNVADNTRELTLQCQFNKGRFKSQTITTWLKIYHKLLEEICNDASRPLSAIPLAPNDSDWLADYCKRARGDEQDAPELVSYFNQMLLNARNNTALECNGAALTYNQLAEQSNQVANLLVERGVRPGDLVGVCLDRSVDLVPCLLGVWKAGAGYVPLDPTFPQDRLLYMTDVAKPALIFTQQTYQTLFSQQTTLLVDADRDQLLQQKKTFDYVTVVGETRAYVIFTSGSTGKPKGVEVPRRAVANFLESMKKEPGMDSNDRLLAVTTLSFDISILELFLPLWVGAKLVIATSDDVMDGHRLFTLIDKHKINYMQATPSTWKLLLQAGWQGSKDFTLLCGGEAFPSDLVAELVPICRQVWNMYGPTETTVWSTCQLIADENSPVVIGRPIANTVCYVADENQHLLPDGIPGELLIGGDGVALGYIGRSDLAGERFINNPFGDGKLYRTGDKVRWTPDGVLEYFGRMDSQVKLRGYRIELNEIEVILRKHPNVRDCALGIVHIGEGDQRLVAYVVPNGKAPDLASIKQHLSQFLPAYMVPNNHLVLEQLPQTLNGKLDRKALAQIKLDLSAKEPTDIVQDVKELSESTADWNDVQIKLLPIWQAVLQTHRTNLDDNFFDLGGHSILIAQLIARIDELTGVRLGYREIYSAPTLRKLAQVVQAELGQKRERDTHNLISPRPAGSERLLSFAQQRLWFMEQLNGASSAYNLPTAFRFKGELNVSAFTAAFAEFVSRQEVMRSKIYAEDNVHAKPVISDKGAMLPLLDWSTEDKSTLEAKFVDYYSKKQKHVFSLQDFPLYVAELIKFSSQEYILFFMPHHVIFDGGSFDIFVHEITTLYCKHAGIDFPELQPLPIQYADFAAWNVKFIDSQKAKKQLDFWVEQLSGEVPVLDVPTDFPRPEIDQSDGDQIEFVFESDTISQLTEFCKKHDVSIFMVLLAAYGLMLHKYSEQTDVVIGAPVADRGKEVESVIGLFVNPLPLRIHLTANDTFTDYLNKIKEIALQALDNSEVPFEKLVEVLNPPRDLSRSPIFQTSITYQDVTRREQVMGDINIEQINIPFRESALDFNMWLKRRGDFFEGGIIYTKALFKAKTIELMAQYYRGLLAQILSDSSKKLSQYTGYSDQQKKELSTRLLGPVVNWQSTQNIVQLLAANWTQHGDKVAAICGDETISYAALNQKSNQLANYLVSQGVKPGELIGISMDRSVDMLVVLLGILKAGAAYLPLDPDFPTSRLEYMVKDSGTQYIVGGEKYLNQYPVIKNRYFVENLTDYISSEPKETPTISIASSAPAYIIYTSGSTGLPKGVVVPHGSVVNFLLSMAQQPGMTANDVLLAVTTLSFDIAVLELYLPLLTGGTVVIAKKEQTTDGKSLSNLMEKYSVTTMQATPSTWRMLFSSGWKGELRLKALCGGEALPKDLAKQLLSVTAELWNMYGPTETTVWSTCFQVQNADEIYLGRPITNTQCYILDANRQLVPEGVPGELCIGGDGVTLGYHQRDQLNAERFITSPFTISNLYRTGDKARLNSDGQLEYMGRMDQQVKLRGYRIELGEIEAQLLAYDDIESGAVVLQGEGAEQKLVAFYTLSAGAKNSIMKIRKHMAQSLPKYMIPEQFVDIDALPLTPNGKVDRKKLSSCEIKSQTREVGAGQLPATESEKYYADLWCKFLKLDAVSINDNFFDVGGHSLLSLEVVNSVREEKGVAIPPRIFVMNTLAQIAKAYPIGGILPKAETEKAVAEKIFTSDKMKNEKSPASKIFGKIFNKK